MEVRRGVRATACERQHLLLGRLSRILHRDAQRMNVLGSSGGCQILVVTRKCQSFEAISDDFPNRRSGPRAARHGRIPRRRAVKHAGYEVVGRAGV